MNAPRGMYPLAGSTPSLLRHQPLLGTAPAPAGTAFVLGEDGGYAAAPGPTSRLVLGRNAPDVHVTVGSGDWHISREHATLRCVAHGGDPRWELRNDGRLPIRIPEVPSLLRQHRAVLPAGYTPLYIQGSRLHVVEVLISTTTPGAGPVRPETGTRDLALPLTERERLVLVAVYQAFLRRADEPHPLSWAETGRALNDVPGQRDWTAKRAEHVVDGVRRRLVAGGVDGADGLLAEAAHPGAIKRNLLRLLLDSATLVPPDLRLLDGGEPR